MFPQDRPIGARCFSLLSAILSMDPDPLRKARIEDGTPFQAGEMGVFVEKVFSGYNGMSDIEGDKEEWLWHK